MGNKSSQKKTLQWPLYHSEPLPVDEQGFTRAFSLQKYDSKELKSFFDTFGIVVFKNVLNEQEIQKTIDNLWDTARSLHQTENQKIDRNDPNTWNFKGSQKAFGFIGNEPLDSPQVWQNRSNLKVYKIFKLLYELTSQKQLAQPLIACFDRGSMMLPSKINPDWQTGDLYHFDIDPWYWTGVENNTVYQTFNEQYKLFEDFMYMLGQGNYTPNLGYKKLAGVLALSDTNEESGGFEAALGFQNYMRKWCQKTTYMTQIESDEQLLRTFQKVFMRKGSLMIFTRQLPHNIYPNKSQKIRFAQYLRMTPQSTLNLSQQEKQRRKKFIHSLLPQYIEPTQIFKEIYMLE